MRRREFIAGLGSVAAWPLAASAQPRLPELALDLVGRKVSLILAIGNTQPALAATRATTTIPVVFANGTDPVAAGLVPSLNRPGGNVTGVTSLAGELFLKRLQLLHDFVPGATRFGVLVNPNNFNPNNFRNFPNSAADAVRIFGGTIEIVRTSTQDDFEAAFATLAQRREALIVAPDPMFAAGASRLVALAARYGLPTNYGRKEFVKAGGLVSYNAFPLERQAGVYVGRILKGEKPGDLPVVQPTEFELVINLKTAKALGLTIPETLLATADEVIR
jgi:putative ABC transport system substrate-binding protein